MPKQQDNKRENAKTIVKHDPENAHAWAVIMAKIMTLRTQGRTMQQIGDLLGVGRDTVSRWISKEFGGEKTTFGDMLRYAKALDVPFTDLLKTMESQPKISRYNSSVGRILQEFAEDSEKPTNDISAASGIPAVEINAIFSGQSAATPEQLFGICTAIEINASIVLKRAAKEAGAPL